VAAERDQVIENIRIEIELVVDTFAMPGERV